MTNPQGSGFVIRGGETNVEVMECTAKECGRSGMYVRGGATVVATRCDFTTNGNAAVYANDPNTKVRLNDCTMHHNHYGLVASSHAVVDLYGEKMDIHHNTGYGIMAAGHAKVQIHLPSQHNTSHDNTVRDRSQWGEGTITNVK